MSNTDKPVFRTSVEMWRTELTPREIHLVESRLEPWMHELGYARATTGGPTAVERAMFFGGLGGYLFERGVRAARGPRTAPQDEASPT